MHSLEEVLCSPGNPATISRELSGLRPVALRPTLSSGLPNLGSSLPAQSLRFEKVILSALRSNRDARRRIAKVHHFETSCGIMKLDGGLPKCDRQTGWHGQSAT